MRALIICLLFASTALPAQETPPPAVKEILPKIDKVFFAQLHVQEPSDPLFRMVGNLAALVKVQVYSETPRKSPDIVVKLELGKDTHEFSLVGPKDLPKPYTGDPHVMPHSYDDSFTGIIPREWIKPGLKVTVELRAYNYKHKYNPPGNTGVTVFDSKTFDTLRIGAPNKLIMTMFDVHFFQEEKDVDFPKDWDIAMADKFPVAEFKAQRVRHIVFDEVIMNPTRGKPAMRVKSMKEFTDRAGAERFDGESAAARHWMRALKRAGGRNYGHSVYFLSLGFVPANGWGERWSLAGTTDLGRMGNFHHELGHVFSLPHWGDSKRYPYKGDMYGVKAFMPNFPHVGPKWAYSLHKRAFISPIVQENDRVGGKVGTWKKDPMHGGGHGDQEKNYMMRHFSDYSVNQMQNYMEKKMLFWDGIKKGYYQWDNETQAFSKKLESDGWNLATDPFADVYSILISASAVTPEANYVYPVIGPYKAGLLNRFDASSADDRKRAETYGFSEKTCDVCLRVTQGGKTTTYLLEAKLNPSADPLKDGSFVTTAINLPAKDGIITQVDLLQVPNVMTKGIGADVKVLYSRVEKNEARE